MKRNMKGKPDSLLKKFWSDNEHFADLFNSTIFNGEQIVDPKALIEVDTDLSLSIPIKDTYVENLSKARDVVKKTDGVYDYIILGVESQMKIDYTMPVRVMLYDVLTYVREIDKIAKYNKEHNRLRDSEEFLSKFRQDDVIHPVITIVVYYGTKEWDGAKDLRGMFPKELGAFEHLISNYKMNLVQVVNGNYHFSNDDVSTVFGAIRAINTGDVETIESELNKSIDKDLALLISSVTDRELWDYVADVKDSGGVNMCKMLDDYREDVKRRAEEKIFILDEKVSLLDEKVSLLDEKVLKSIKLLMSSGVKDSEIMDALDLTSEQLEQYKKKIGV